MTDAALAANAAASPTVEFLPAKVDVERRDDGTVILSSPYPLAPYERHVGVMLRDAASDAPDRIFLAERPADRAPWRTATFAEMRHRADAIAQTPSRRRCSTAASTRSAR